MALRKEILEAIKDGTITPEEGLQLLEEIEEAEALSSEDKPKPAKTAVEESAKEATPAPELESADELEQKAQPESETILEDELVEELENKAEPEPETEPLGKSEATPEAAPKTAPEDEPAKVPEPKIEPEPEKPHDPIASLIDEWEMNDHKPPVSEPVQQPKSADTRSEKQKAKENDSLVKIHALDQQIDPLRDQLKERQELFRNLNLEVELEIISDDNMVLYQQTKKEMADIEAQIKLLNRKKEAAEKDFYSIPVWKNEIPKFNEETENPWGFEDDEEEAPAYESTSFNSRVNDLVNRTLKTVADTVDGKWNEVKLPGAGSVGNTKFEHDFTFRDRGITDLDIKLANGTVIFETWSRSDIYVEAEIKLQGKMYGQDPMDAFMERSQIQVDEDKLLFHVHNKRVTAELTFYLPEKMYDHVMIRLLNGDLIVQEINAKDIFIKATNGDLIFKNINAAVLEIQGTKNEIEIYEGTILDSIIETANGSIVSKADVANFDASLVNGQIKLSVGNNDLRKIKANSVNGTIKISLPTTIGLEGIAKTSLGEINYRLSDFQTVRERRDAKERLFHFRRPMEPTAQIEVSSKTGSIFLKDFAR
ncbi:daptomycin-sensing surface protein LiaX [Enterococcus sp. 669A]|uniref:Daptomycin-sensing surface protein LiaX n=1 Tax=Candidatus Enterococcus moelleringii TaxID=2815325 RepID=A0ABS3LEH6_9ENTE|nr:daptomycin-sensing surface protein LiaX [Enterococcus sp. 669A]MBO1308024.1 daptomycin-sensing surface protein LiaX [Enterococcus sp. 669A]